MGCFFYHLYRVTRKNRFIGKVVLTLIYRLHVLDHATDEWYWKLTTLLYAGETYALPGKGGGINSVIRWQQMHWQSPLKARCSDKIAVREFVRDRLGDKYLIPMLPAEGVFWTNPDDIDFEQLPSRFVLKLNNGSGMNLIVNDKTELDIPAARQKMRKWLASDFATNLREWHYRDIPNRIYCEEFIDFSQQSPPDYKFMCSNGRPLFLWVDTDRYQEHKRNFFNLDFEELKDVQGLFPKNAMQFNKPQNWERMLEIAGSLSKGIPIVRIDLYNIDGKIYFGEMTFTPSAGWETINPQSFSQKMAAKIDLKPF